ncbi:hypothetical protein pb186bvf_003036 [Paramecium bursaria]
MGSFNSRNQMMESTDIEPDGNHIKFKMTLLNSLSKKQVLTEFRNTHTLSSVKEIDSIKKSRVNRFLQSQEMSNDQLELKKSLHICSYSSDHSMKDSLSVRSILKARSKKKKQFKSESMKKVKFNKVATRHIILHKKKSQQ